MDSRTKALIIAPQLDLDRIKALVLDAMSSAHSKRIYNIALSRFLTWYTTEPRGQLSKSVLNTYRSHLEAEDLAPSSINVALSAIRKLVAEATDNGLIDPGLAAGIMRVKGVAKHGTRTGNWLTARQAEELINAPDVATLKGKRDRAIITMLIGCGLRRSEVTQLNVDSIQMREGRWAIVDLIGKGKRVRTVPMPSWTWTAIQAWLLAAGIENGRVFRSMARWNRFAGAALDDEAIHQLVQHYADDLKLGQLNPHDLRRTFAKLAHKGRAAVEQIQLTLGHASMRTTELYLGIEQDLTDAPCDRLNLQL
jgi:site-specific recombinase XerD